MKGGMVNKAIDFAIHNPKIAATAAAGAVATVGGLGVYAYDRYTDAENRKQSPPVSQLQELSEEEQKRKQELEKRLKETSIDRPQLTPPLPPRGTQLSDEKSTSSGGKPNATPSPRTQPNTITATALPSERFLIQLQQNQEIATKKLKEAIQNHDEDNRMPIAGKIVFDCGQNICEYVINDGGGYYNMTLKSPPGKRYEKIPMSAFIEGKILSENFSIRDFNGLVYDES